MERRDARQESRCRRLGHGRARARVQQGRSTDRRRPFPTRAAAKAWREDKLGAVKRGELRSPTATTVRQAADAFLAGARDGSIPTASGARYKPATLRGYKVGLNKRVLPALGDMRLSEVQRRDVQDLADRLTAEGLSASTVQNTLDPLRVIFRRAIRREEGIAVDPTSVELLAPITLHEARHTCASILIAAGVNAKALSIIMGHSTIAMTFDTYGHLMPGGLDEAAAATNAYLARLGERPALKLVA